MCQGHDAGEIYPVKGNKTRLGVNSGAVNEGREVSSCMGLKQDDNSFRITTTHLPLLFFSFPFLSSNLSTPPLLLALPSRLVPPASAPSLHDVGLKIMFTHRETDSGLAEAGGQEVTNPFRK